MKKNERSNYHVNGFTELTVGASHNQKHKNIYINIINVTNIFATKSYAN